MIILQFDEEGLPFNGEVWCALDGCKQNGYKYISTTYDNLPSVFNKYPKGIPIGTVEYMSLAFKLLGIKTPILPFNSNRESMVMTLKEAIDLRDTFNTNIFIKPKDMVKAFTGFVHEGYTYTCLKDINPDIEVLVYDPFPFPILTEWRSYIHNHHIIDIRNYSGDYFHIPNKDYIQSIVDLNKSTFPIAYSIDVGILSNGQHVVIEYNDFWALGNYGIPNWLYIKCLIDRWYEISSI